MQDSLLSASYVQSPVLTAVLFRTNSPRRHFSPTYENSVETRSDISVCLFVCLVFCSLMIDLDTSLKAIINCFATLFSHRRKRRVKEEGDENAPKKKR